MMSASRIMRPLGRNVTTLRAACACGQPFNRGQPMSQGSRRTMSASALKPLLRVSEEVSYAVANDKPVVALESTIYTHGAMGLELAAEHDKLVRDGGAVPAIIAIVDGVPSVGVSPQDIVRMIETEGTRKASRRDIAYLVGMGLAGQKIHGGTTISGTMLLARLAGIRVFGTGGLGGVHRGGENSLDISADLTELGRTRVAVISSGCKGFLDLPRTLEFLETQGCLVSTFADGRSGSVDFPAFWARDSGVKSPFTVQTEKQAAAMILAQEKLNIESGLLFANPIPEAHSIPADEIGAAIEQAVSEAEAKGFTGSTNTPYVLLRLKELTGDKAVAANKVLVRQNIARATTVAVELSRLMASGSAASSSAPHITSIPKAPEPVQKLVAEVRTASRADILVAGSVAVDLNCDYSPDKVEQTVLELHTSNPASISQSIGGVGHNVALAAHLVSRQATVKLCSMVGDDVAGSTILSNMEASGLDTTCIKTIDKSAEPPARTAQYVAVNDGRKGLQLAMADMGIFTEHSNLEHWESVVSAAKPKWLVVDGNWSATDIRNWIRLGNQNGSKVAFEPVSSEKSRRLFCPQKGLPSLRLFPEPSVHLASPNTYELAAMYATAQENGYFDNPQWFEIIDSFGMRGARDRFVQITSAELTDAGVPVQSVQLLPYIPTIITKLGSKGALLTTLISKDDPLLRDVDSDQFILARSVVGHPAVGGIYMRPFPPAQRVDEVVSVNGVGDTFLGALISGLAQGGKVEQLMDTAQKAAVLSLKHLGGVSPKLRELEGSLTLAVSRA